MHHRNQQQSLRNKEKVLHAATKIELQGWVRGALCGNQQQPQSAAYQQGTVATFQAEKCGRMLLSLL